MAHAAQRDLCQKRKNRRRGKQPFFPNRQSRALQPDDHDSRSHREKDDVGRSRNRWDPNCHGFTWLVREAIILSQRSRLGVLRPAGNIVAADIRRPTRELSILKPNPFHFKIMLKTTENQSSKLRQEAIPE